VPLEAAIIAVADAWDAMTSDRPYRRALSRADALAELRRGRGAQWSPGVVDALLDIVAADHVPVPAVPAPVSVSG
jgi:HD-GYP domain-containing protein (c-di-GMP phosphodiesterase class II)